tara:strand:+ start:3932 stop:4648 length:717 start_codon:yes stop_codon:yes gene_type:complete
VCVDANAAARNAARQRWMEKDAKYRSESLKYWNRETSAIRGMQRAATGYSRAISNDYQRALYVQGQARKAYQAGFIKYQQTKGSVDEGGRDRRARKKGLVALTRARGQLDNAVQNEFGVQMQRRYRARTLQFQNFQAKKREALGIRPEYGAPVLMPPSDRLSGALSIASQVIGIVSGIQGLGLGSAGAGAGISSGSLSAVGAGAGGVGAINSVLPHTIGGGIMGLDPFLDPLTGGIGA